MNPRFLQGVAMTRNPQALLDRHPDLALNDESMGDIPMNRAVAAASRGSRVSIGGLNKSFGSRRVLFDIDLDINPGEFVAILGRSGCGKSTLLRLITGLDAPDASDARRQAPIRLNGEAKKGIDADTRIMFQDARLLPWQTVIDNVALALPKTQRDLAQAALKAVDLLDRAHDWPGVLSGGQRQRVALARALVHSPRLLLLDEPLGALDALTRIEMQQLIEQVWLDRGFTTVLVTHDVNEAVALADRVVLMEGGRITVDLAIDLPRPRERGTIAFARYERELLQGVLNFPRGEDSGLPAK
jgi:sulfonate transport system ATP-binding protein